MSILSVSLRRTDPIVRSRSVHRLSRNLCYLHQPDRANFLVRVSPPVSRQVPHSRNECAASPVTSWWASCAFLPSRTVPETPISTRLVRTMLESLPSELTLPRISEPLQEVRRPKGAHLLRHCGFNLRRRTDPDQGSMRRAHQELP